MLCSIERDIISTNRNVVLSAIVAVDSYLHESADFAESILGTLHQLLNAVGTRLHTKLTILPLFRHMHHSAKVFDAAWQTLTQILSDAPLQSVVTQGLTTMTKLVLHTRLRVSEYIDYLVTAINDDIRSIIRTHILKQLLSLASVVPDLWTTPQVAFLTSLLDSNAHAHVVLALRVLNNLAAAPFSQELVRDAFVPTEQLVAHQSPEIAVAAFEYLTTFATSTALLHAPGRSLSASFETSTMDTANTDPSNLSSRTLTCAIVILARAIGDADVWTAKNNSLLDAATYSISRVAALHESAAATIVNHVVSCLISPNHTNNPNLIGPFLRLLSCKDVLPGVRPAQIHVIISFISGVVEKHRALTETGIRCITVLAATSSIDVTAPIRQLIANEARLQLPPALGSDSDLKHSQLWLFYRLGRFALSSGSPKLAVTCLEEIPPVALSRDCALWMTAMRSVATAESTLHSASSARDKSQPKSLYLTLTTSIFQSIHHLRSALDALTAASASNPAYAFQMQLIDFRISRFQNNIHLVSNPLFTMLQLT
jgi:hypothetical protein